MWDLKRNKSWGEVAFFRSRDRLRLHNLSNSDCKQKTDPLTQRRKAD